MWNITRQQMWTIIPHYFKKKRVGIEPRTYQSCSNCVNHLAIGPWTNFNIVKFWQITILGIHDTLIVILCMCFKIWLVKWKANSSTNQLFAKVLIRSNSYNLHQNPCRTELCWRSYGGSKFENFLKMTKNPIIFINISAASSVQVNLYLPHF